MSDLGSAPQRIGKPPALFGATDRFTIILSHSLRVARGKLMIEHGARFGNCEPLPAWREVAVSNQIASLSRAQVSERSDALPLSNATMIIENGRKASQRLKRAKKASENVA